MASMSRSTSDSPPKGFSILQPVLGAALSWMPAVGSPELEQLIDAYLPGPASAHEKRAAISMDFFEYSARTGENFKYYPVAVPVSSPTNSALNPSPTLSDLSYYGSPSQSSTPLSASTSATTTTTRMSRGSSHKSTAKTERTDFSHLPGMKIMTAAGEDVTNSVSRGCKTKEQREHAHLMRVLKACDACKRKKIRCDPSHKRRTASQTKVTKAETAKTTKKAKKASPAPSSQASTTPAAPDIGIGIGIGIDIDLDIDMMAEFSTLDQSWDDLLSFNNDPINAAMPDDFYGAIPQDFDYFLGTESNFSPTNSASAFTDSPSLPLTPEGLCLNSQTGLNALNDASLLLQANDQEPILPYLDEGFHGSNYVDFNLYSPQSSCIDEEPLKLRAKDKKPKPSTDKVSSAGQTSSQSCTTLPSHVPEWQVPGVGQPQQSGFAGLFLDDGFSAQQSWHADDGGHGGIATRTTTATPPGLPLQQQPQQRPGDAVVSREAASPSASPAPASAVNPRPVTATRFAGLAHSNPILFGGEAHMSQQAVSPTVSPTALSQNLASCTRSLVTSTGPAVTVQSSAISSLPASVTVTNLRGARVPLGGLLPVVLRDSTSNPSAEAVEAHVQDRGQASTVPVSVRQPAELGAGNVPNTVVNAGLASPSTTHGSSQPRQSLHGETAIAATSSLSPTTPTTPRLPVDDATSPVRQLLSQPTPSLAAQLAVCGLVSLLLLIAAVGVTPLLQNLQIIPTYTSASAKVHHYLPTASSSCFVILSVLSTLSAGKSFTKASVLNSANSARSFLGRSPRQSCRTTAIAAPGLARVSMACF